jgi:hypothetical protein
MGRLIGPRHPAEREVRALKAGTPVYEYEPGTWGPKEVDARVAPPDGWQDPKVGVS